MSDSHGVHDMDHRVMVWSSNNPVWNSIEIRSIWLYSHPFSTVTIEIPDKLSWTLHLRVTFGTSEYRNTRGYNLLLWVAPVVVNLKFRMIRKHVRLSHRVEVTTTRWDKNENIYFFKCDFVDRLCLSWSQLHGECGSYWTKINGFV